MDYTQELTPAVIYARYSSSGQREESIEGQRALCAVLLFLLLKHILLGLISPDNCHQEQCGN